MNTFKYGHSELSCKYLFSKDLLEKARSQNIRLFRQIQDFEITEDLVTFIAINIVDGWSNVFDVDGNKVEFDRDILLAMFEQHPTVFIELIRYCSKLDNFRSAA